MRYFKLEEDIWILREDGMERCIPNGSINKDHVRWHSPNDLGDEPITNFSEAVEMTYEDFVLESI